MYFPHSGSLTPSEVLEDILFSSTDLRSTRLLPGWGGGDLSSAKDHNSEGSVVDSPQENIGESLGEPCATVEHVCFLEKLLRQGVPPK